jgi:putative transposase
VVRIKIPIKVEINFHSINVLADVAKQLELLLAPRNFVRKYENVSNRRRDWFWKLAHELTDKFDVLCFETLNFKGMQRLWGRKISDLAFGDFLQILEWIAKKKNKLIVFIDQWYPSSKTCSQCGHDQ